MAKNRRVRDDVSKNHISVECIPRRRLSELAFQLLQSGFGELDYFVYHPTSESCALHSRTQQTFRKISRLTDIAWIPFKGKQEDIPFIKHAIESGDIVIEKIMLVTIGGEETRNCTFAASADINQAQLVSRIEYLEEKLAGVHKEVASLRAQLGDARAANEVTPNDCEIKSNITPDNKTQRDSCLAISKQDLAAKITNSSNEANPSGKEAEGDEESAGMVYEVVGSGASVQESLRVRHFRLATAGEIPMKVANIKDAVQCTAVPPAGYRAASAGEVLCLLDGKTLVGKWLLYYWPTTGWVRGRVHAVSRSRKGYSHVVTYSTKSAIGPAAVPSLLDAASHGPAGRWILLLPTC